MISEGFFSNPQTTIKEAFDSGNHSTTTDYGSFVQQTQQIINLNTKHDEIEDKVATYDVLKSSVESNTSDYADFSGNYLHYRDHPSNVKDAVKEDIHMMILQQNNAYIIGMITVITVMITTYLVTKK